MISAHRTRIHLRYKSAQLLLSVLQPQRNGARGFDIFCNQPQRLLAVMLLTGIKYFQVMLERRPELLLDAASIAIRPENAYASRIQAIVVTDNAVFLEIDDRLVKIPCLLQRAFESFLSIGWIVECLDRRFGFFAAYRQSSRGSCVRRNIERPYVSASSSVGTGRKCARRTTSRNSGDKLRRGSEFKKKSRLESAGLVWCRRACAGRGGRWRGDPHLREGLNVHAGKVANRAVAEALSHRYRAPETVIR